MRRLLLLLPLLVACATAPEMPTLQTRLTVEEATRLGAPVRLRLELVNATGEAWSFDDQQAGINGSLEVVGPDGARAPYVGPSCQTVGGAEPLPPGETAVLFSGLDLGGQYLLDQPGRYTVRYVGRGVSVGRGSGGDLWSSRETVAPSEVTFDLAAGEVPRGTRIARALLAVAPEGWQLEAGETSWRLTSTGGSGLKSDVEWVKLRAGARTAPGEVRVGRELVLSATSEAAARWPDHQVRIEAALRAE